jgi:hypothetical protein
MKRQRQQQQPQQQSRKRVRTTPIQSSSLLKIPSHIHCSCLLPFIPSRDLILSVQLVSKQFHRFIQSREMWDQITEIIPIQPKHFNHIHQHSIHTKFPIANLLLQSGMDKSQQGLFLKIIKTNSFGLQLKFLTLTDMQIEEQFLIQILSILTNLRKLSIGRSIIDNNSRESSITSSISKSTKIQDIQITHVTCSNAPWLMTLIQNSPDLESYFIDSIGKEEECLAMSPPMLKLLVTNCSKLKNLFIHGASLNDEAFIPILDSTISLERLHLMYCSVSAAIFELLASSRSSQTLESIRCLSIDKEPIQGGFYKSKPFQNLKTLKVTTDVFTHMYQKKLLPSDNILENLSVYGGAVEEEPLRVLIPSFSCLKRLSVNFSDTSQLLNLLASSECAKTLTKIKILGEDDVIDVTKLNPNNVCLNSCKCLSLGNQSVDTVELFDKIFAMFPNASEFRFDGMEIADVTLDISTPFDFSSIIAKRSNDKITNFQIMSCGPNLTDCLLRFALSLPNLTSLHLADIWSHFLFGKSFIAPLFANGLRKNLKEIYLLTVNVSIVDWVALLLLMPNIEIISTVTCAVLTPDCRHSMIGRDEEFIKVPALIEVVDKTIKHADLSKERIAFLKKHILTEEARSRLVTSSATSLKGYEATFAELYKGFRSEIDKILDSEMVDVFGQNMLDGDVELFQVDDNEEDDDDDNVSDDEEE